jgi:hypothetical protein
MSSSVISIVRVCILGRIAERRGCAGRLGVSVRTDVIIVVVVVVVIGLDFDLVNGVTDPADGGAGLEMIVGKGARLFMLAYGSNCRTSHAQHVFQKKRASRLGSR